MKSGNAARALESPERRRGESRRMCPIDGSAYQHSPEWPEQEWDKEHTGGLKPGSLGNSFALSVPVSIMGGFTAGDRFVNDDEPNAEGGETEVKMLAVGTAPSC